MVVAHRRRSNPDVGFLPADTPYVERSDRHEGRFDNGLLKAWGRVSAHWLSGYERGRLARFVLRVEAQEDRLGDLWPAGGNFRIRI